MIEEYNPKDKEEKLLICTNCGVVMSKCNTIVHTRDDANEKIAYIECPVCGETEDVDYNY